MTTASHHDGPITPPATPLWNQSSAKFSSNIPIPMNSTTTSYPSPTTSSSRSSSSASLRPSFSTRSTSIRENVQVMVRCRPRSEKELEYDEEPCWLISPEEGLIEQARLKAPNSIRAFYYGIYLLLFSFLTFFCYWPLPPLKIMLWWVLTMRRSTRLVSLILWGMFDDDWSYYIWNVWCRIFHYCYIRSAMMGYNGMHF